jgi:hypothetical protein
MFQTYAELREDPARAPSSLLTFRRGAFGTTALGRDSRALDELLEGDGERTPTPREVGGSAAVAAYAQARSWAEDSPCGGRSSAALASPPDSPSDRRREYSHHRVAASQVYAHSKETYCLRASRDSLGLQSPADTTIEGGGQGRGSPLTLSQIADIDPSGL